MTRMMIALSLLAVAATPARADLASLVDVRSPGTVGRVTFAGVGIGSTRDEGVAALGDNLGFPGDGAYLGTAVKGEPGTELEVLWQVRDGRVEWLWLMYTGERAALRRVAAGWREILAKAGAKCGDGACHWYDEDGELIARLDGESHGRHGPEVLVEIAR